MADVVSFLASPDGGSVNAQVLRATAALREPLGFGLLAARAGLAYFGFGA